MPSSTSALRSSIVAAMGVLLIGSSGCVSEPTWILHEGAHGQRYSQYALRGSASDDRIRLYRSNYLGQEVQFQPGAPVKITGYSPTRLDVTIEGKECSVFSRDHQFPSDPPGIDRFLDQHFGKDRPNLADFEESVQTHIKNGRAAQGMTKAQVIMALGYPSHIGPDRVWAGSLDRHRILEHNVWLYRQNDIIGLSLWRVYKFDTDGKLATIE